MSPVVINTSIKKTIFYEYHFFNCFGSVHHNGVMTKMEDIMSNIFYAGIGSRSTPAHILLVMQRIAEWLASRGVVLRSGAAAGADSAFESGCDAAHGTKQIFVPWPDFQHSSCGIVPQLDFALASRYHPAWHKCSEAARKLLARDLNIIGGADLHSPVRFVVCYTPDGTDSGGTGQALRYARDLGIPVFNLGTMSPHDVCTQICSVLA